ncbi:long-chain fatty acid--CoA ligase [Rhodococcus erythropolis]|uniref:AMP-dependent synthetase/ligase n=1 Tax=Rhodococcus erythropolis TaxID=1833 RepID=UPI00210F0CC4|nr:long-chain fatty acid--CoA ligase [Rhodococcus erythropolis]MCQ4129068.1 long-chain fatty acid--CoA ligase [Rhodococcus erythropolis]
MKVLTATDEQVDWDVLADRPRSVAALLDRRVSLTPELPAYLYPEPKTESLLSLSWRELRQCAHEVAAGLMGFGVELETPVAICAQTSFEWVLADLGIACAGGATTTIYPTTKLDELVLILEDSASAVVFVESQDHVVELLRRRADFDHIKTLVTLGATQHNDPWVVSIADLRERGRASIANASSLVDQRISQIDAHHLGALMYTSGTTGPPKGVRLAQDSIVYQGSATEATNSLTPEDLHFLWLPLSHVFGKMLSVKGLATGCATVVDGRMDRIAQNLGRYRPTFMAAAPRIFEKLRTGLVESLDARRGVHGAVTRWALRVGNAMSRARQSGQSGSAFLRLEYTVADRLVLRGIRRVLGGRVRYFICGSAPLDREVAQFFGDIGILVCEGYGLTESSAGTSFNRPASGGYIYGSIGLPMPGTTVRVSDETGELLIKGPGVMLGYNNSPEATAAVLSADGWLHTGDVGRVDDRGFIYISGRRDEMFKTSGGKKISPGAIEAQLKARCPYLSHVVIVGEGRHFVCALVTLDNAAVRRWAIGARVTLPPGSLANEKTVRALVQGAFDDVNMRLNRWETIKNFVVLEEDLTIEAGELTASLKVRRSRVTDRYRAVVDEMYAAIRTVTPNMEGVNR